MARYTEEKVERTLKSIQDLLNLDVKQREKILELQRQLIRINRAIKSKFWLEGWKKIPLKEKVEMIKNERCVKFNSYNMTEKIRDFPIIAKTQWEKDRQRLIKSGEIKP